MSATLVAIDTVLDEPENKRETRLRHACHDAYLELNRVLGAEKETTWEKLRQLVDAYWHVSNQNVHFHRWRARRADRILRRMLDKVSMEPEVRQQVVEGVAGGKRGRSRDSTLLTEYEHKLVEDYRTMSPEDRQTTRTILDRFAAAAKARTSEREH